ncbi:nucleotidyltransferase family protein [Gloeobacter violaceus]|uniref:Glr0977 protein n=1 Tax=Gloeobacter violaceus (strain ATCC 29082 / PCC 7421) TaxID=251221 RepID=Q7NLZ2_GLOVI|nr:nucleotidyltransferase domain-containing protein [Gloeobacter violaceus]BAC88918.1 glr0977 [Gloeobacter violaceus PCC 7421]
MRDVVLKPLSQATLQNLLRHLRTELEVLYGSRLKQLILFGSYARSEAHAESDIDILAVLTGDVNPVEEIWRTSELVGRLSLQYGHVIGLLSASESDYQKGEWSFLSSVRREGIPI